MSRRFALLLLVLLPLSGCSACVDQDQLDRIDANMDAVPEDAREALGAEKVKIQTVGATASDGVGSRKLKLRLGPSTPTALDAYVRGCQAAVAALAPTNTRLYGLPAPPSTGETPSYDDSVPTSDYQEIDDERCLRGYGVHDLDPNGDANGTLLVAVRGKGGSVVETAVVLDPAELKLSTSGSSMERGQTFVPTVAPLAGPDRASPLPATPKDFKVKTDDDDTSMNKVFLVPAGQKLTLKAACTKRTADESMGFRPRAGNSLAFYPMPLDPADYEAAERASCTDTLVRQMRPQLRYPQGGDLVDEYWLSVYASAIGAKPSTDIRVTAAP